MTTGKETNERIAVSLVASFVIIAFFLVGLAEISKADTEAGIVCDDCCAAVYTNYYRCSGNVRERLYQNSDCSREWKYKEYCEYGCTDGECLKCSTEYTDVEVFPVGDVFKGDTLKTTINVRNSADQGRTYYLDVQLCRVSGVPESSLSDCMTMECETPSVYIGSGGSRYVRCSGYVGSQGSYRIKAVYTTNQGESSSVNSGCDRTAYSNSFKAFGSYQTAYSDGDLYAEEYRCFGKYLQQKYSKLVGDEYEWRWKVLEYCENGCYNNQCIQLPDGSAGNPEIFMGSSYKITKCGVIGVPFSVMNNGDTETFSIGLEGEASMWMEVAPEVTIGSGETAELVAYVSIPCDVQSGKYPFAVTVSGKADDVFESILEVERTGMFSTGIETIVYIVFIFAVTFSAFAVFKGKISVPCLKPRTTGRKLEEKFRWAI